MRVRKQFDIDIIKLSNSVHEFQFNIDSSFFAEFEDSLIQKGNLKAKVILEKSSTLIQATFEIDGVVELICDRSLEPFDLEISITEPLIFKYGEEYSELTEEIITIPRDLPTLNVSQYIYEFIGLAVPMKKLHPKFRSEDDWEDEEEEDESDSILIYSTQTEGYEDAEKSENSENNSEEGPLDPRWEILKNIKKNLN